MIVPIAAPTEPYRGIKIKLIIRLTIAPAIVALTYIESRPLGITYCILRTLAHPFKNMIGVSINIIKPDG